MGFFDRSNESASPIGLLRAHIGTFMYCVKRNGVHAVHALVAVEMAMMGIRSVIPPDDVIDAMGRIGRLMPVSLRETSLAGLAMTEEGKHISERLMKQNAMPAE